MASTEPMPEARLQVKAGWLASELPNWSSAVAVNCWVWYSLSVALAGVTLMVVSVGLTVTFTLLVVDWVPSLMVTRKV